MLVVKFLGFMQLFGKPISDSQTESIMDATVDILHEVFNINAHREFEIALDASKKIEFNESDRKRKEEQKKPKVPEEYQKTFEFVQGLSDNLDKYDPDLKNMARAKKKYLQQHGGLKTKKAGSFFNPSTESNVWKKMKDLKDA